MIVWLYLMCWSSYGFECCATFAPEYIDPARDTAQSLRAAAVFCIFVYGLLPLGAVGTFGDKNITFDNALFFYGDMFKMLVGCRLGERTGAHALRGPRALDEHRHDGRIESAVRHLAGRHDVQASSAS